VLSNETPVVVAIGTAQATAETNLRFFESELLLALYGVGNKLIHLCKMVKLLMTILYRLIDTNRQYQPARLSERHRYKTCTADEPSSHQCKVCIFTERLE